MAGNTVDMLMGNGSSRRLGSHNAPSGVRASSALFVDSDTTPEPNWETMSHHKVTKVPRVGVEVRVPAIDNASDYETDPRDPTAVRVLGERSRGRRVYYEVEKADGSIQELPLEIVSALPGGRQALQSFQEAASSSSSSDTDPLQSDSDMVVTRRAQPTRRVQKGFIDISKYCFSNDDEDLPFPKRRKRSLVSQPRLTLHSKPFYKYQRSESSSAASGSSESSGLRLSKPKARATRNLRSNKSTANGAINYDDELPETSESDEVRLPRSARLKLNGPKPTRRSERTGRHDKSMREVMEDDIPVATSRNDSHGQPKVVGAKETFKSLPKDDEFRQRHCQACDTCNGLGDDAEKGKLVFCQGCTLSYHVACLGNRNGREHLVTKAAEGDFVLQCRRCVDVAITKEATAPRRSNCQECHQSGDACKPFRQRKTTRDEHREREQNGGLDPIVAVPKHLLYNVKNVMFRCSSCYLAFHMHHLPSQVENILEVDDNDQKATVRYSQYCRTWTCDDCAKAVADIGALVAWRPTDLDKYIPGHTVEQVSEDMKEYLIKWHNKSYYRSTWKRGAWVWGMTHKSMRIAFARKDNGNNLPKMRTEDAIPEDYLRVDIVFEVKYTNIVNTRVEEVERARVKEVATARMKFKGLGYEDVVWEEPPSPNDVERFKDWKLAYEDWVRGRYVRLPSNKVIHNHVRQAKGQEFEQKIMLKQQPETIKGGKLMDYQTEGVNWLLYQWHRGQNAILADEMGLGKTIQIIAFMAHLQDKYHCWPFLVVVPNSTCANWRREIKHWAPGLRVVTYFGSAKARELAYKYELFPDKAGDLRCHVVVTSYDAAQDEGCQRVFKKINWATLIVDEGQRLKNDKNLLYNALSQLKFPFKILLTGTPLQNNQRELFNLLQFLDDKLSAEKLEETYAEVTKDNVGELHELLRPFFLRRTKVQVLKMLPPMAQIIVPVSMSTLQKELYKSILAKNSDLLKSIFATDQRSQPVKGLRNVLMQLRKCLCHPFVYNLAIEERSTEAVVSHRRLVEASSKLQLLEIMLPLLKARGHRVLVFSQFLDMLTLMEDFLDGLSLEHLRLDGSMGSLQKQKCIDQYNAPDSSVFAFLLSTRAGGVGINLASADTVIILDPDFNPHQDIQAISRAHRIGQKKKVLIFQMMTRESAEEKIMQIGKKKMALDHVLIEAMDAEEGDVNDLESVLKFGAEALFKDDNTQDIKYDAASVEKLLERSQIEDTKVGQDNSAESQFSFARIWQNDSGSLEEGLEQSESEQENDGTVWKKILEERANQARMDAEANATALGRGKRQRKDVDYGKNLASDRIEPVDEAQSDNNDTDFQARASSEEDSMGEEDGDADFEGGKAKPRSRFQRVPLHVRTDPRDYVDEDGFRTDGATFAWNKPEPEGFCMACKFDLGPHPKGDCRFKAIGVEYCNLCGSAHYGHGNNCPHFKSETMVARAMDKLRQSPEHRHLLDKARAALQGVKAGIIADKKRRRELGIRAPMPKPPTLEDLGARSLEDFVREEGWQAAQIVGPIEFGEDGQFHPLGPMPKPILSGYAGLNHTDFQREHPIIGYGPEPWYVAPEVARRPSGCANPECMQKGKDKPCWVDHLNPPPYAYPGPYVVPKPPVLFNPPPIPWGDLPPVPLDRWNASMAKMHQAAASNDPSLDKFKAIIAQVRQASSARGPNASSAGGTGASGASTSAAGATHADA